jgi:hypothetical protein
MHRLRLDVFTHSGTGSIADSIGMEGFLFKTKEWVIRVNNTTYYNVTSTATDGFLKLRWTDEYSEANEYIIFRGYKEIGRSTTCEFIDKGYVGEGAEYYIKYKSPYSEDLQTLGRVEIPKEIKLNFTCDVLNNYQVSWGKLKYYAAVDTIIVRGNDGSYAPYEIQKTTDVSQTGFSVSKKYFGQQRNYSLTLLPKYYNPLYNGNSYRNDAFTSSTYQFTIGYPSPLYQEFMRINGNEFIYHTNIYKDLSYTYHDSIYRYSAAANKYIERFGINRTDPYYSGNDLNSLSVSADGSYIAAIYRTSGNAFISSGSNLRNFKIFEINGLVYSSRKIPMANNGIGLVYGGGKKYLYDFKTENILGYANNTTWHEDYNISPDGTYFFLRVSHSIELYSYANNVVSLKRDISSSAPPGFDYFNFMANEAGNAVCWNKASKVFSIIKYADMQIVKSFNVNEDEIWDIDYYNKQILSFSSGLLVVRSLDDGSVLFEIPVSFTYRTFNQCYLCGNSIFHQEGARYFLK